MDKVMVVGRDATGRAVAEFSSDEGVNGPWSMRYYLSPCCAADGKGVTWGTGVCCRACYAVLPVEFGGEPGQLVQVFGDGISLDQFRTEGAPDGYTLAAESGGAVVVVAECRRVDLTGGGAS